MNENEISNSVEVFSASILFPYYYYYYFFFYKNTNGSTGSAGSGDSAVC